MPDRMTDTNKEADYIYPFIKPHTYHNNFITELDGEPT